MAGNQASLLGSSENEGGLEATGNSICCGIYRLPPEVTINLVCDSVNSFQLYF